MRCEKNIKKKNSFDVNLLIFQNDVTILMHITKFIKTYRKYCDYLIHNSIA